LVIISVYPNGANLDASAYLSDNIKKRCATEAIKPIIAIINHWFDVGLTQTAGIKRLIMIVPTTPDNNNVKRGLSDVLNFLVIIK